MTAWPGGNSNRILTVRVRRFRTLYEVERTATQEESSKTPIRVWEEGGEGADALLRPEIVLNTCRVVPNGDIATDSGSRQEWGWSDLPPDWTFAGVSLVREYENKGFEVIQTAWRRRGCGDVQFVDMRAPDICHNAEEITLLFSASLFVRRTIIFLLLTGRWAARAR